MTHKTAELLDFYRLRLKTPLFTYYAVDGYPLGWQQTRLFGTSADAIESAEIVGAVLTDGVCVLDPDLKNGGDASFERLTRDFNLPPTFTVRTASGGHHYYFQSAQPLRTINRGVAKDYDGVDFLSKGSHVVAAGSVRRGYPREDKPDGEYVVVNDAPVAYLPERLRRAWQEAMSSGPTVVIDADDVDLTEWDKIGLQDSLTYWLERVREAQDGSKYYTVRDAYYVGVNCGRYLDDFDADDWWESIVEAAPYVISSSSERSIRNLSDDKLKAPNIVIAAQTRATEIQDVETRPVETHATRMEAQLLKHSNTGLLPVSHLGMALRVARKHSNEVMYVGGLGWFAWDGTRWREDPEGAVVRRYISQTVPDLYEEAAEMTRRGVDAGIVGKHVLAATRYQDRYDLQSVEGMLRDYVEGDRELLDGDPRVINVANGVVILPEHADDPVRFEAHSPSFMCTRLANVSYHPEREVGGTFLDDQLRLFFPVEGERQYFQKLLGLTLVGDNREQLVTIHTGKSDRGANGKGTVLGAFDRLFGDYSGPLDNELVSKDARRSDDTKLSTYRGKRMLLLSEFSKKLDTEKLKAWTGGDPVQVRVAYARVPFDLHVDASIHISANSLPEMAPDAAWWRRAKIVTWRADITQEQKRPSSEVNAEMDQHASELLNWAIEGYRLYLRDGLTDPESVTERTRSVQADEDWRLSFIETYLVESPGSVLLCADLWKVYQSRYHGREVPTRNRFYRTMDTWLGESEKTMSGKGWHGWKLRDDVEESPF
ncbi:phage/plasmid primase, P4 family, C-terminal domain-containing protein [Amycolatopsis marina]|uniref:Phage/plasmid primase, P4 family, C-terminal domain-containing protein n=1 Tax=Amycolatopsis marina TaxID=490629 RepID=A0A1I1CF63_9PSEU|nr:phage/plasmid primase, P4 family [Amycolatopsis marina]SFB61214.1 phage/plasmid primase, P4 family, C-terminal domain-containing protein [Amycolatopsis marina]